MTLKFRNEDTTEGAFHLTTHEDPLCIVLRMDRVMYDVRSIARCVENLRALAAWLEEQARREMFKHKS